MTDSWQHDNQPEDPKTEWIVYKDGVNEDGTDKWVRVPRSEYVPEDH